MRDESESTAARLMRWYDAQARDLPWRVPPHEAVRGVRADPYRVWLSEVMLQQTTVAAVRAYYAAFTIRWPTVQALARAEHADVMAQWAGLGYYARARNLLKCAGEVADNHGGRFPDTVDGLRALPGIGPYTAAAIAAIAFDRPAVVVDGNVERVMARLFDVHTPLPAAKGELTALAGSLTPQLRAGCHAQAVMDLGATVCTPRNPACGVCPLITDCKARAAGTAQSLPRKTPKAAKPVRVGIAYIARRSDGAWLLETRPAKGLLGGMLGWPGSDWAVELPDAPPPLPADWRDLPGEVRHTFTHFHLRLALRGARVGANATPTRGRFIPQADFRPADLPTVMRKAFELARADL